MSLAIDEITTLDGLRAIETEWRELWDSDPAATPFQSPDWLLPWTARLWGGGEVRALALREGVRLAAVAPFFLWGFGSRPERICLSFLGSGVSDYLGVVCRPEFAPETARLVLDWILRSRERWQTCDLQELREGDALLRAAAADLGHHMFPCSVCPVAPLADSMEDHLNGLDPKFRRNLRTAGKRLEAAGRVELARADESNVACLLDHLFRLHSRRWEERSESGMLSSAALQAFHTDVARRFLARGLLRLFGLFVDGECIAAQYNFSAKGRVYLYLSGFDVAWNRFSPGAVLLGRAIAAAIDEGARECDFLRKPEAFKHEWGAVDRRTMRLLIPRE